MESVALSVGKSALSGALGYAKSAVAKEVALQLGVRRDQAFITDELEMMQGFLVTAHDERDDNRVVQIWVKQVCDMAYDVEDCLMDFAVHLCKKSWWRIPRTLLDRRHVAMQMKELRAKVEDVSQRNTRYNLIKGSSSKSAAVADESVTAAAIFGMNEARRAAKQDNAKVYLFQLINNWTDNELRVIAVWGTSADLGQTSTINAAYENPDIKSKFACRAWVRVMHPFNPKDFIQSLVEQFHASVGVDVLLEEKKLGRELAEEFKGYVNEKKYLIVLTDLSTIEEWNRIKQCFPDNQKGSRILVLTTQAEVASLCVGQESIVSELKQLSADQTIYAFHSKGFQDTTNITKPRSSSNNKATTSTISEISEDQPNDVDEKIEVKKTFTRMRTTVIALEESHLVGREKEKTEIIKLICLPTQQFQVISIWGMGGLGKTTLIRDIYESQELSGTFEKRACATIMRPFILDELLRSLVMQLNRHTSEEFEMVALSGGIKKTLSLMSRTELIKELTRLSQGKRCFIVLDNISSTAEWNQITSSLPEMEKTTRIMVTTREERVARHCSVTQENIYHLKILENKDGRDLFMRKVFGKITNLDKQYPSLVKPTNQILKKCNGLPLAIVTIGGFLANQPKTALEWRKLNEHISVELEMNPELETIITVLRKSIDGLPYHLKSCFLYLPKFPEDCDISQRRLVRRWAAEGYPVKVRGKSAEETANNYFMDLISRSMILAHRRSNHSSTVIESCQVHDLIREIAISKSVEENLVFRLEEGNNLNCQGTTRHLVVSSNWHGDKSEFESTMDLSRIRSFTVFGKWKPFYISAKMRLLRVLDLEGTSGLFDHHLVHIRKLLHLRYLSVRGCSYICHLPELVANLRQIEMLDIKGTRIIKLPSTIIKLRKLHHILAGILQNNGRHVESETYHDFLKKDMISFSLGTCMSCCAPIQYMKKQMHIDGDFNRRDLCTGLCCYARPELLMQRTLVDAHRVAMPRGISKLKVLRSLGLVYISREKGAVREIKKLTWLRKLGVAGINKRNSGELCSAIAGHSRLESLLLKSQENPGLSGCLDGLSPPPPNLQSLKLYGNLATLPKWIQRLGNLVKLKLQNSMILDAQAAIQVLGKIPNLSVLLLWWGTFYGAEVCFSFHQETFPSLVVLQMDNLYNVKSVEFKEEAAPKLEQLQFYTFRTETKTGLFHGLPYLRSLKEVTLDNRGYYANSFVKELQGELGKNPNGPVFARREYYDRRMAVVCVCWAVSYYGILDEGRWWALLDLTGPH